MERARTEGFRRGDHCSLPLNMNLLLAGINHRTAPVEVRERMNIHESHLAAALADLMGREGVREGMILSTCNRVEVIVNGDDQADPEPALRSFLADIHHCDLEAYSHHLYWLRQNQAVEHLFRVASSLDSMILGEPQILGQMRQAFVTAQEVGALHGPLYEVANHALAVAKRVRRETAVGSAAVSVSYAAVELARKIFGNLEGKSIFVIGAGKMSELASKHLISSGASTIFVTNRTHERAEQLAQAFHGLAVPFDQLHQYLHKADIIISSTGAPHYVIHREQAEKILAARRNRPVFFVDIAVPRDIDPAINNLDNVFVYDIDDLQQVVEANRKQREREAEWAEEIVQQETQRMMQRLASREVVPTIVALEERLNRIRAGEMERFRGRLGALSEDELRAVEGLTEAIVNKILHGPITELKTGAGKPEQRALVHLVRRMFSLSE
jgi:glutamyl-tRNA reductase